MKRLAAILRHRTGLKPGVNETPNLNAHLIRRALIATLALAAGPLAFATGNFFEESLPTLADVLRSGQLPAKTIGDIARDQAAQPADPGDFDFRKNILALAKLPAAQALAAVEKMLPIARAKQTESGPGVTNLLHDLRDLFFHGKAAAAEIADYVDWRVAHTKWFGFAWLEGKADGGAERAHAEGDDHVEIDTRADAASPALKPHWLYLRGAADFKSGDDSASEDWFQKVVDEFPAHPRAESAQFMVARCLLSQSRVLAEESQLTPGFSYVSSDEKRETAAKAFRDYLAKYPKGRFAGDALGWLGAAAYDAHDYVGAIRFYIEQAALPDHPEFAAPAAAMGEKTLSRLASAPDEAKFSDLAKTPVAALGLVYLILNTSESDDFNGEYDAPEEVRKWRREILPRVGKAIAANEALYKDAAWRPRYLAMLALASSGAGDQDEALRLVSLAGDAKGDDLLFARGVAMQRAKRPKESAAAFAELIKSFPNSALAPEVGFRLAFALFDDHRAGEALVMLLKAAPKEDEDRFSGRDAHPVLSPLDPAQFGQLIDAIFNFAPVPELIAGAETPGLDPLLRMQITEVIAQRLLAKEQFDEARKYVPPAQWSVAAEKIATLTAAAKSAQAPAQKAAACLALGDAWAAARGKLLTAPLDTEERRRKLFRDDHALGDVRRAANAQALNAPPAALLELENRDELRHAFNWWIEASDAQPKTPLAAQALWRALRAMPLIADVSRFHYERAVARNWGDVSRKLYDRLRKEHAASDEARKLAVYWNFSPAPKRENEESDGEDAGHDAPRGGRPEGKEARPGFATDASADEEERDRLLVFEIAGLKKRATTDSAEGMKKITGDLQRRAHKNLTSLEASPLVNYVDDLALFFSERDPGAAVRARYVEMRTLALAGAVFGPGGMPERLDLPTTSDEDLRADIAKALADPAMRNVADYLAYLDCSVVANHIADMPFPGVDKDGEKLTYRSRDYAALEEVTRAFLEKYPRNRKREAALLLHAKALSLGMKTRIFDRGASWPAAPRWEGGSDVVTTEQIPFNAKRLKDALDQYEKEFPRGRYAKEIRDFRATLAVRLRDWKATVARTVDQLDDAAKPSLQDEAGRRLTEIFNALSDETARPELLAAIKANRRAVARLREFIDGGGGDAMFACLTAWLREQIGR